ncbi:hypothetical protein D6789_01185 [Candidatus Woesearchaeota archaeon]|nr:MAG: hypothetical protein D6789_01185 [Candidatus Woesearchaeota archaeon]
MRNDRRGVININDIIVLFVLFFVALIIFGFFVLQRDHLGNRDGKLDFAFQAGSLTADFVMNAYLRQRLSQPLADFAARHENGLENLGRLNTQGLQDLTMEEALVKLLDDERCIAWLSDEDKGKLGTEEELAPLPTAPPILGDDAQSRLCHIVHRLTFAFFRSFVVGNLFSVHVKSSRAEFTLGHAKMRGDPKAIMDGLHYLQYNNLVGESSLLGGAVVGEWRYQMRKAEQRLARAQLENLPFAQAKTFIADESDVVTIEINYIGRYDE